MPTILQATILVCVVGGVVGGVGEMVVVGGVGGMVVVGGVVCGVVGQAVVGSVVGKVVDVLIYAGGMLEKVMCGWVVSLQ